MSEGLKRCSRCRKRKPLTVDEFYYNVARELWDTWCRTCKSDDKAIKRALAQGREVDWTRLQLIREGNAPSRDKTRKAAYNRIYHLAKHGLTPESYQVLLDSQGGACAACGSETPDATGYLKMFPVDHDHSCCPGEYSCGRCVRGLLCAGCNTAAGVLESLRAVAVRSYLERTASYART